MKLTFDVPDGIALGLKKVVEEIISELTKWPQKTDQYWFLCADGLIVSSEWCDDLIDQNHFAIGNCFKTEKDAEFKVEQLKVLHELEELADDDEPWKKSVHHYTIYYSYNINNLTIGWWESDQHLPNTYYFKSIESAEAAISKIGEERLKKYYFCIPEDKI